MPVKRIADINIKQRGLFTAIYGNVNENEFFVDDDLRKYSLWQQLYLYLKEQGYEMVLFYDTTNNFHSYGQNDLINFLSIDQNAQDNVGTVAKNRYEASHILSPLRHNRLRSGAQNRNNPVTDDNPAHRSIQLYKQLGTSNNFWRTTINRNLLEYFTHVMPEARRTAIIIKYPDNSHFENVEQYLTLFKDTNAVYNLIESQNKIIVVYGCANSSALIENLNRNSSNLFVADYFKSIFLTTETDSYRTKTDTTFQVTLPEQTEIRNWLNRKRISNNISIFNTVPLDKIILRFVQERKRLADLENYDIPKFIRDIDNTSGLDRLNEMIGLDAVKSKVKDIIDDLKAIREENLPMTYRPHLCFIGNPGTGKTTVASIVAEIFKEEGIVPLGHYTYAKATELMGQYVGEAQSLVKKKCEEATGGVLFIDEAYAFIDEGTKAFGDSAVTELIAWLEDKKWQKETIVILAGYPDEIEELFKKSNKGLKGRFTDDHFLTFENYNADQLFRILELNAQKNRITISDDTAAQLKKIFGKLLRDNADNRHWDNARRVENIFKILYTNSRKRRSKDIQVQDIPESMRSLIGEKAIADISNTPEFIQLHDLIGLDSVKQTITDLIESIEFEQYQLDNGIAKEKTIQPLHLVFTGPPGTGKTTVARLFGALLKNLGILPRGHVIEANRKDLVADYVGQTATKTSDVIQKAMGGILFIDEAYTLSYGGPNDFGREAIDTLLPIMENDRDKFVVIAAGYESNMNQFLNSNPGLNDRFNQRILFPSLSETELIQVFNLFCHNSGLIFEMEYHCILIQYFSLLKARDGEKFSNSRTVRKLFEETNKQQKKRLNKERKERELTGEKMRLIVADDLKDAIKVLNPDILPLIDFKCLSESAHLPKHNNQEKAKQQEITTVVEDELATAPPISKKAGTNEGITDQGLTPELKDAIEYILYDYCIIDTNIWMPENKEFRKYNHNSIRVLMNTYKHFDKKLIAHGKTYEELQRIKGNRKGTYTEEVSIAAAEGFRVLTLGNEDNLIDIPELKGEHEERAYADLAIYEYAHKKYKEGKSICLISNDKDCRVRVRSTLTDNKSSIAFKFLKAHELKKLADAIFYSEWYQSKFPRR